MKQFCSQCGAEQTSASSRFCAKCGAGLADSVANHEPSRGGIASAIWRRVMGWSWWQKTLAGGFLVLVLLVILGAAIGDDETDNQAFLGGSVTPDATVPAEPTTEARPTLEPSPTPGLPKASMAECAYLQELLGQTAAFADMMSELSRLMSVADVLSDEWVFDMGFQLGMIRSGYADALTLEPPPALQAIHNTYLAGVTLLNDSTFLLAQGIDNLDGDAVLRGDDLMREATSNIILVAPMIENFNETRSGSC